MKLTKLIEHKGQRLKLLPAAEVWTLSGCQPVDDVWTLVEIHDSDHLELRNNRTSHVVRLSPDHVHHFTSSPSNEREAFCGWLELIVRIDLSADHPKVTPIPSGVARTLPVAEQPPLRTRLAVILDTINPAIRANSRLGIPISVMISDHNLQDLLKLQIEPGFDELLHMESNGNMAMGQGAGGRGINDLDQMGVRHGYNIQVLWGGDDAQLVTPKSI